eukprot:jgi/Botrbrau1/15978/Bobra.0375s0003.3
MAAPETGEARGVAPSPGLGQTQAAEPDTGCEEHLAVMAELLDKLARMDSEGYFKEPVRAEDAPNYFEIIENPMDFRTMREKVRDRPVPVLEGLCAGL